MAENISSICAQLGRPPAVGDDNAPALFGKGLPGRETCPACWSDCRGLSTATEPGSWCTRTRRGLFATHLNRRKSWCRSIR